MCDQRVTHAYGLCKSVGKPLMPLRQKSTVFTFVCTNVFYYTWLIECSPDLKSQSNICSLKAKGERGIGTNLASTLNVWGKHSEHNDDAEMIFIYMSMNYWSKRPSVISKICYQKFSETSSQLDVNSLNILYSLILAHIEYFYSY